MMWHWAALYIGLFVASFFVIAMVADSWEQAKNGIWWANINAFAWMLIIFAIRGIFHA